METPNDERLAEVADRDAVVAPVEADNDRLAAEDKRVRALTPVTEVSDDK